MAPLSIVTFPYNLPLYGEERSVAVVVPELTVKGGLKADPFLKFKDTVPSVLNNPELCTVPPVITVNVPEIKLNVLEFRFNIPPPLIVNIPEGLNETLLNRVIFADPLRLTVPLINVPAPEIEEVESISNLEAVIELLFTKLEPLNTKAAPLPEMIPLFVTLPYASNEKLDDAPQYKFAPLSTVKFP